MLNVVFFFYLSTAISCTFVITPKDKINVWLYAILTPLCLSIIYIVLVGSLYSAYAAGGAVAHVLIPSIIMFLVIYFGLRGKLATTEKKEILKDDNLYSIVQIVLINIFMGLYIYAIYDMFIK